MGGVPAHYIARWNGSTWSAVGSGMDDIVHTLTIFGEDLYAGGSFAYAGGTPASYIARWDGSSWSALAGGLFGAGLIADLFLVRFIYRAAELYQEAQKWTVGALLTFPFGTLVFAWLLARRLRHHKPVSPPA